MPLVSAIYVWGWKFEGVCAGEPVQAPATLTIVLPRCQGQVRSAKLTFVKMTEDVLEWHSVSASSRNRVQSFFGGTFSAPAIERKMWIPVNHNTPPSSILFKFRAKAMLMPHQLSSHEVSALGRNANAWVCSKIPGAGRTNPHLTVSHSR